MEAVWFLSLILVGTSRCDVPARVGEGGTKGARDTFATVCSVAVASLGDGAGAARQPYQEQCQAAPAMVPSTQLRLTGF